MQTPAVRPLSEVFFSLAIARFAGSCLLALAQLHRTQSLEHAADQELSDNLIHRKPLVNEPRGEPSGDGSMLKFTFWASLTLVLYVYVGYPVLVYLLGRRRAGISGPDVPSPWDWPFLSVLIPAHNEERWIRRKIENALELDYPRERLRIVVASDASTDRTVEIAREFSGAGVEVVAFPQRLGKEAMLNRLVPQAHGEILVVTDANALLQRDAIKMLSRHFVDPCVGCVTGKRICVLQEGVAPGLGESMYWRYESWIKQSESRVHSCLGAHGQLYAVRREVFPRLGKVGDDFYIPMKILATTKLHVKFEPQAIARIPAAKSLANEVERKTRAHVSFLLMQPLLKELWNPLHPVWWQYISHHVSRMVVPIAMLAALGSSLALAENFMFYRLVLATQLVFYVLAGIGYALAKSGEYPKIFYVPFYFVFANLAIVRALLCWPFRKHGYGWKPTERLPVS
jgi:biofilm PGA synthesis N-glycosyltransferase PgaC